MLTLSPKEAARKYQIGTSMVGLGFLLALTGYVLSTVIPTLGITMYILGIIPYFWGCYYMAKGKGYSGSLALLGLLSLIGIIVLFVLPNRYKKYPQVNVSEHDIAQRETPIDTEKIALKRLKIGIVVFIIVVVAVALWTWYFL